MFNVMALAHDLGVHQLELKHKMHLKFSQRQADLLNAKIFYSTICYKRNTSC